MSTVTPRIVFLGIKTDYHDFLHQARLSRSQVKLYGQIDWLWGVHGLTIVVGYRPSDSYLWYREDALWTLFHRFSRFNTVISKDDFLEAMHNHCVEGCPPDLEALLSKIKKPE